MEAIVLGNSQYWWQKNSKLSPSELQGKALCADMLQLCAALLNYTHFRHISLILIFIREQPKAKCSHSFVTSVLLMFDQDTYRHLEEKPSLEQPVAS